MKHRYLVALAVLAISGMGLKMTALMPTASAAASTPAAAPPNFIVIFGEGAGWVSTSVQMDDRNPASKGTGVRTPSLERLATTGMRFSDGYAASPRCTPSRAALLTGRSPAALHMTVVGAGEGGNGGKGGAATTRVIPAQYTTELPLNETTIAELLKRSGYATAHFGKWHLGKANPSQHGFDESDGPTSNGGPENVSDPNPKQALAMAAELIGFMERQVKAGKPFYAQMSEYPNQSRKGPEELDEESRIIDSTIGQVLDAVEKLGIKGNTYIVYTTDHGTQGKNGVLAGGKGDVLEGGIRVPFLVSGPGVKGNAVSHVRVSATDLFPTFAALAGVKEPLPKLVEGGSLVPVLSGGGVGTVQRPREEFVVHFPHYDKNPQGPASSILLGDYKLTHLYETGENRLFDLTKDPGEKNDLAKQMPDRVAQLETRLNDYLKAVNASMPSINTSVQPGAKSEGASASGMGGGMGGGGGMAGGMAAE